VIIAFQQGGSRDKMQTIYDWVSLAIFAGLVVLFLQRSTSEHSEKDVSLLYYLGAGVGCAAANYFGNHDQDVVAIVILIATIGFIFYFLKPFQRSTKS
jgi:hypothetical protein